jgi:hypothetical protein
MWRSLIRRRGLLAVVLVLCVVGPASAGVLFALGFVWPAAVPVTPAAQYLQPLTINTAPPAVGGYGDTIQGIETGRDDRSPYCALVVVIGTANPAFATLQSYAATWPPIFTSPPGYPTGSFTLRLVYRPINDPANPGWGGLPGAALQLDQAWQTVQAVASELAAHRTLAALGGAPGVGPPRGTVYPFIYLEFDPIGPTSVLEFYKVQIVR